MICYWRGVQPMRRFLLTAIVFLGLVELPPLACHAGELRVAIPSTGLAFSVAEVSDTGYAALQRAQTEASLFGTTGCLAYCEIINKVWAALQPVFKAQEGETALNLLVVRSPTIDAVAFANGTLVISENFIARTGLDEAQIAFVLAHEASHVLLQHERQTLTSMLALRPSRLARTPEDLYVELEYNYFSMSDAFSFIFQQIEFEADETGMQLAALAGFEPQLQLKFMEQLALEAVEPGIYTTHPPGTERLQRLRDKMPLAMRLFQFGRE